jgi:hypothetical protein
VITCFVSIITFDFIFPSLIPFSFFPELLVVGLQTAERPDQSWGAYLKCENLERAFWQGLMTYELASAGQS